MPRSFLMHTVNTVSNLLVILVGGWSNRRSNAVLVSAVSTSVFQTEGVGSNPIYCSSRFFGKITRIEMAPIALVYQVSEMRETPPRRDNIWRHLLIG